MPVVTFPVMDKAERRALIERPARRRRWRRIAECYAVGLALGPIVSAMVNHGHLHLASGPEAALVTALIAILAFCAIEGGGYGDKRAAVVRAVVIVLFGSALFVLPRSATLVAIGSPFSWTIYVRWLICAVPYPLVADLLRPGGRRSGRITPLVGLICLALAWPLLMTGMIDAAAAQTRAALGAPDAMLLFVDPPAPESINAASYTKGTLLLEYGSEPLTNVPEYDRAFDDLDMVVFPARAATPCSSIDMALANVHIANPTSSGQSCTQLAPDLWQDTGLTGDSPIEIEKYAACYVTLILDGVSHEAISPASLPALFRAIHRADDAELAALGEADVALVSGSEQQNPAAQ